LGEPQSLSLNIPEAGIHSPHAQKALSKIRMFPDRL
jgi:hypothetical protein